MTRREPVLLGNVAADPPEDVRPRSLRAHATAPIPEWQRIGDPRAKIRTADILQMSGGVRIRAPQDPDYDPSGRYPDHLYLHTGGVNSFHYAATRPQQWPPATSDATATPIPLRIPVTGRDAPNDKHPRADAGNGRLSHGVRSDLEAAGRERERSAIMN